MIKGILFDLDDTLLGNPTGQFMDRYFSLLGEYVQPSLEPESFLKCVMAATQETITNTDPALTNADVFWLNFTALCGLERSELEPFLTRFYDEDFPRLRSSTTLRPAAAELVAASFDKGLQVVIATNPLFPRTAIEQRLEWAGIPIYKFDFTLVTTYENMHAAKPQPAYYEEIIERLDLPPQEALMVGDSWENDIVPSRRVGLHTFWINDEDTTPNDEQIAGCGTLSNLRQHIEDDWLDAIPV